MDKSYLLSAILPLMTATLSATFLFLWYRQREKASPALNWSLAYACATIGSSIDFARALFEDAALVSFYANIFLAGVAFFAVRGTNIRHTGKALDRQIVPIYAATVIAGAWLCFIHPSILGRGVATSLGAAMMFVIAAGTIRRNQKADKIDQLIVWVFALSTGMMIARIAMSLVYDGPLHADWELLNSVWIVSFKVFAILSWLAFAILFLLRITTDLMSELSSQSLTDPLTGIPNRRGFFSLAGRAMQNAIPALPVALMICDIDRFKQVNDTYGHRVGDIVIQGFASLLHQASEGSGCIIGRLGGEEFVAFFPVTNLAGARVFAEGLRSAFATLSHEGIAESRRVTVSIGVAESGGTESLDALIERADGALYKAKRSGRNRVEITADIQSAIDVAA